MKLHNPFCSIIHPHPRDSKAASIFGGLLPFYETTTFDKNNVLDLVLLWGLEWKQVKGCCHQRHTTICLSPLKSQRSLRVPQQAKLHTDPDE